MSQRFWFVVIGLFVLVQPLWGMDRPNVIFLMTDDQRADSLGCMGNPVIQTPNIDAMASQGLVFDNAFVTTAICMTSRASVFTGQYAARHGVWSFSQNFSSDQLNDTYLGRLKAAGYRTGFIGKWGVGNPKSADDVLDFNRGFPGQSRFFEGDLRKKEGRHLTAKLGDQALEFIEGCKADQPFHLSVSFKAPHCQDSSDIYSDQFPSDAAYRTLYQDVVLPRPPTAAYEYYDRMPDFLKDSMNRDRWAVRFRSPARFQESVKDYYRLITGVDAVVGRIRQALEKQGLAENTVIIFTSDHGFFLGEYGFAGKWTPHEVSIRIPLVILDPRDKTGGQRRAQTALNIDMAPTILDFANVEIPAEVQGRSLKPLLQTDAEDWRDSFFYEHWFNARGRIAPSEGVRTSRWKYCRYLVLGEEQQGTARWEELFDLDVDPHEKVNLADNPSYAAQLEQMRSQWREWREKAR